MQFMLPVDAIIANGAGNNAQWLDRFYQYRSLKTKLTSRCGSMGYGVPAAIAAKLALPEATVVSWNGDGCFQMNMNELVVASKAGLKVIFIIVENGVYGTIRQHQEKTYPCHKFGTDLDNPDFMKLAAAYGCLGMEVSKTEEFRPAFQRALEVAGASIITLKVSPDLLSPSERLSNLCPVSEELA
ncbi:MAG: acetolactate synthase [Candidatus Competibacteraceae bacterium]|nr:acetolactate synthase [Candidatus Competibacteraceae bacterium]